MPDDQETTSIVDQETTPIVDSMIQKVNGLSATVAALQAELAQLAAAIKKAKK